MSKTVSSLNIQGSGEVADVVFLMDQEGRIMDWPPAAENLFGWGRAEALGQIAALLLLPEPMRNVFCEVWERQKSAESASARPESSRSELTTLHKSGKEICINFALTRFQIDEQIYVLGQARNAAFDLRQSEDSSRQKVESQLKNQATALSSVDDSLHESLRKCLESLCSITSWPVGFVLIPDRSQNSLCTSDIWHVAQDDRLPEIDPERFQIKARLNEGFVGQIWRTGEPTWSSELGDKDSLLPAEFRTIGFQAAFGFPVVANEQILAVLVFFSWEIMKPDPEMLLVINNLRHQMGRMVERKQWIEERARLAAIVDSSSDGIIGKDLNGKIIAWNQGAEQMYGYSAEEVLGKHISIIYPKALEHEESEITDVATTGERLSHFETKRRAKDGRLIDVALSVSPIRDARGQIVGTSKIERDISLRKLKEKELRQAKREAEKANQAKSEFLANISHELRTPMNAILGMLNLSLGEELSEVMRDYLATAHESAQTLLYLLNDLLDFSRMSAGHLELESDPFLLRETLDMLMRSLSLRASEKGLELACHLGQNVPNAIKGDALRLRQILINLAGNAIKFTDQGEVVVDVTMQSRRENVAELLFSVRDTGIGIPEEDQHKIFAPFTQVDASTTRKEAGSGLGLAIVRELVGKMGGTIGVESDPGRGSRFYFAVPFEVLRESPSRPASAELAELPILVVDDNRTNQLILQETLSSWSMRPTVVGSAKAALKLFQEADAAGHPFAVIIVDALMPEMDGFRLVEKLNEIRRDACPVTVLMLSSADRQTFKQRCEEIPISAFLEKPVSESELLNTLLSVMDGPMLSSESFRQVTPIPHSLSILVAEDTPANQKVVRAILEKRGHQVQIANNGREAVDQLKQQAFDLVLMDVQMPTMDGLQAVQTIRQLSNSAVAEVPIVAMTAHARREDRRKCLAAGMDAYIAKPIDATKLLHLVESVKRRTPELEGETSDSWEPVAINPEQSQINVESAKARMGGNKELVADLARYFLEDAPKLVKDLERGLADGHPEVVERAAHSLKGLAANFDAETLATVALVFEAHGRNAELEKVRSSLLLDLRTSLAAVSQALEDFLESLHQESE